MLSYYLSIAWRQLRKSRLYSSINIIGLAIGLAVVLLIGLWIQDELSFDHYHQHHAQVAEVLSVCSYNGTVTAAPYSSVPLAEELRTRYKDDFKHLALIAEAGSNLTVGDIKTAQWGWYAQAEFPEIFSLEMLKGSRDALNDPTAILLTESLAQLLFGQREPLGETVLVGSNKRPMRVAGIYADLPENTTLHPVKFLMAWGSEDNPGVQNPGDWSNHHFQLFVQLNNMASLETINARIKDVTKPHSRGGLEEIRLHPMDRWHLYDTSENGRMIPGRLQSVQLFGLIGLFVLLLACINFMNLSTAKSEKRAREVGVRKAAGSLRSQLIAQFLCESLLVSFLAMILAVGIAQLAMPLFNGLSEKHLSLPYTQPLFWIILVCFAFVTGLVAGSYPAFYLSSFQPSSVLKGTVKAGRSDIKPRKVLVVLQFMISNALIIATLVVSRQIHFAKDRPVRYTPAGLITMAVDMPRLQEQQGSLRYALLQTGAVTNMAISSSPTTNVRNDLLGYDWEGRDPRIVPAIGTLFVSYDFGETIGWQIMAGRDFSRDFPADSGGFVVNETAARFMGMKNPVGRSIHRHGADHPIIGVVRDMVLESPYQVVEPTFFMLSANENIRYILIRIAPGFALHEAVTRIEKVFKRFSPDSPFQYWFADEAYGMKFREEEHTAGLASIFASLAIFISCLGLFGLASFVADQRTREIGIRKVLGASVVQVWMLLSKEFLVLVVLSFLIAAPVAGLCLAQWLNRYAYHTALSWSIFAAAGLTVLMITLLTVSAQAIRVARTSPALSLKAE
jgi:ABC-type antimicrobial peptide transport system permease subunit